LPDSYEWENCLARKEKNKDDGWVSNREEKKERKGVN